jgi:hypothetical protein
VTLESGLLGIPKSVQLIIQNWFVTLRKSVDLHGRGAGIASRKNNSFYKIVSILLSLRFGYRQIVPFRHQIDTCRYGFKIYGREVGMNMNSDNPKVSENFQELVTKLLSEYFNMTFLYRGLHIHWRTGKKP